MQTYTIRPLEWHQPHPATPFWRAGTALKFFCGRYSDGRWYWRVVDEPINFASDEHSAKRAAEAHRRERIERELVPVEVTQHDGSGQ